MIKASALNAKCDMKAFRQLKRPSLKVLHVSHT